jgi:hypothetical protein
MKAYEESGCIEPGILDLDTRWRKVVSFMPGRFIPMERALDTYCTGGWVGVRAGLNTVVRRKIPSPSGTGTPDHPARIPD